MVDRVTVRAEGRGPIARDVSAGRPVGIPDRLPDRLRKLHSFLGIFPVGFFLVEHLVVSSAAIGGPDSFRRAVAFVDALPGRFALEVVAIAVPLFLHALLGVLIATEPTANDGPLDARTKFQRVSGILLLPYLFGHVWSTRFSPARLDAVALDHVMRRQIENPLGLFVHIAGVVLASFHLGMGLPAFATRWGFARTEQAVRRARGVGLALAVVLTVLGVGAVVAFARMPAAGGAR
jgi:succinate dehydrogenase / fumarate reductase cytochrome b subunit